MLLDASFETISRNIRTEYSIEQDSTLLGHNEQLNLSQDTEMIPKMHKKIAINKNINFTIPSIIKKSATLRDYMLSPSRKPINHEHYNITAFTPTNAYAITNKNTTTTKIKTKSNFTYRKDQEKDKRQLFMGKIRKYGFVEKYLS